MRARTPSPGATTAPRPATGSVLSREKRAGFASVARHQCVECAASHPRLTRGPVSRHMRALEASLACGRLTRRRRMALTQQGCRLLRHISVTSVPASAILA
ncbi:LysR family transcriptional regulator [Pandoraea oxalativorans]|uniref:LysR family transcriptional regulator n=1 Tax=Pandoraea oxalativorans TaxID=573737 RepID=UPI003CCBC067